jgi:hypothetical protein
MRACTNNDALGHMRSPRRLADNEQLQSAKVRGHGIYPGLRIVVPILLNLPA